MRTNNTVFSQIGTIYNESSNIEDSYGERYISKGLVKSNMNNAGEIK